MVTQNHRGALFSGNGEAFSQPAFSFGEIIDATGAGDCFAAALISSLIRGQSPWQAMKYAAVAAALIVSKISSSDLPSQKEIEQTLKRV